MSGTESSSETMTTIITKLEDIYNSQAALNQKMAVVQMALEEAHDAELEATLLEAYGNAQRNAELIREATRKYEMVRNARKMEEN